MLTLFKITINKMLFSDSLLTRVKDRRDYLSLYCIIAVLLNLFLLQMQGYDADLGYWESWVRQLSGRGYDGFNGNYPPLYIHWLYCVGKIYGMTDIALGRNQFLKFLTQVPVIVFHVVFIFLVYRSLLKRLTKTNFNLIMLLAACSPAILINGPVWGQVDILGPIFVVGALLCAVNKRSSMFAIPLYMLSLLTKFQMIAFAPVMGFLFFLHFKRNCVGLLLSGMVFCLAFSPFIFAGYFIKGFSQAYLETLGQYPMTTFNAANIWILLTANVANDDVLLFGFEDGSPLSIIFTAKYFGMLTFSIISLGIFIRGLVFIRDKENSGDILSYSLFSAFVCALAFFTFLPAMHERYLFPAVVLSIMYVAASGRGLIYACIISVACALNMVLILELNESEIWTGLSIVVVLTATFCIIQLMATSRLADLFVKTSRRFLLVPFIPVISLVLLLIISFCYFNYRYSIERFELKENQKWLTELTLISATQDHGRMRINRNYSGSSLVINGRSHEQGIGTHANSSIKYRLPQAAETFSVTPGLDGGVKNADVKLSVWGDGKQLWSSKILRGFFGYNSRITIDVKDVSVIELRVDALTSDKWDHVNWVNTVVTLGEE